MRFIRAYPVNKRVEQFRERFLLPLVARHRAERREIRPHLPYPAQITRRHRSPLFQSSSIILCTAE